VDVRDLPAEILGMTSQPILLAYRYVSPGFEVALDISKHKDVGMLLTVIDKAYFTIMQSSDGKRITKAIYNVRNNRNQFLRLRMPDAAELWSATVAGRSTQPAKDTEGRVLLPLVRSQGSGSVSAFPVEVVYAEQGTKPDERGEGTAKVDLPACSEPIMHLMVKLHVPEQGRYREFDGTLRQVTEFTVVGGQAAPVGAGEAVQALQEAYVQKSAATVAAAGAQPIEVQLPITGKIIRLEKILVVQEPQWFSYTFSRLGR
jgi:hypothetical protein